MTDREMYERLLREINAVRRKIDSADMPEIPTGVLPAALRGYIIRGAAGPAWAAYDANNDGYIIVGDGTDVNSVAVSGDATLANTGALTVAQLDDGGDKLDVSLGGANRTLTLGASAALNQNLRTTDSPTFADVYVPDGGEFGISGNELLTVNAAGTFAFSGISGVTIEDGDWIGNSGSTARLGFDSSGGTDYAYFSRCNVGIETTDPDQKLTVGSGTGTDASGLGSVSYIHAVSDTNTAITVKDSNNSVEGFLQSSGGASEVRIGAFTNHNLALRTNNSTKLIIDKDGNVGINEIDPDYLVDANGVIGVSDNAGDPSTATNKATFYGKDVSGTVEAFAQDEAGNAAQLTPHNYAGPVQPIPGTLHWSQYHVNHYAGVEKWYDLERALLKLEELTGEKFIYAQAIERRVWTHKKLKPRWMRERITK